MLIATFKYEKRLTFLEIQKGGFSEIILASQAVINYSINLINYYIEARQVQREFQ